MSDPIPNPDIFCERARTYSAAGRYQDALALYGDIIAFMPNHPQAYADRGTVLTLLRQDRAALADIYHAIELGGGNAALYNVLGTLLMQMDRLAPSLDAFSMAVELDPAYAVSYYNRAAVFKRLRQKKSARIDLETCLAMNPDEAMKALIERRLLDVTGQDLCKTC
jgi:tetratricopeptide (TPR) repeat protein